MKRFFILFISNLIFINLALVGKADKNLFKDSKQESVKFYARKNVDSDKKIARNGILIKRPKSKATVLICHGIGCDKYDINFLHLMFKDYNSMTFDFRAHGEDSDGDFCTFGRDECFDVIAAAEFIKNQADLKDKPLIVYGFSMGAVASILAQAQDKDLFNAMILDCPFDSSDKLLDRGIEKFKIKLFGYEFNIPGSAFLRDNAYNPYVQSLLKFLLKTFSDMDASKLNTSLMPVYPEEAIKYIDIPVFLISCINDNKAPQEAVNSIYNGAQGFKRFWRTKGRRHFDSIFFKMQEYFYRVDRFIEKFLNNEFKNKVKEKIIEDY